MHVCECHGMCVYVTVCVCVCVCVRACIVCVCAWVSAYTNAISHLGTQPLRLQNEDSYEKQHPGVDIQLR